MALPSGPISPACPDGGGHPWHPWQAQEQSRELLEPSGLQQGGRCRRMTTIRLDHENQGPFRNLISSQSFSEDLQQPASTQEIFR